MVCEVGATCCREDKKFSVSSYDWSGNSMGHGATQRKVSPLKSATGRSSCRSGFCFDQREFEVYLRWRDPGRCAVSDSGRPPVAHVKADTGHEPSSLVTREKSLEREVVLVRMTGNNDVSFISHGLL